MAQRIFEYAIIFHPVQTKEQRDAGQKPKSMILTPVTQVLAIDEKEVGLLAARSIPSEYTDKLDQVEIAIRPF